MWELYQRERPAPDDHPGRLARATSVRFSTCESKYFRHEVETVALKEGGYSVHDGKTAPARKIIVERKRLADLFSSLGVGRARFQREFERMAAYKFAAIVIAAPFSAVRDPNKHLQNFTAMNPGAVMASLIAWSQRYHVHVLPCSNRNFAELLTFRILERHLRDRLKETAGESLRTSSHAGAIARPTESEAVI